MFVMYQQYVLFFTRMFGVLVVAAVAFAVQEGATQITKTKFSCSGRSSGYYADVDSGCQVYHMCDGLGRQFSYTCPNATLFQQRMLICDHWYMVNCSKSEDDYAANLRIGQREMPFVDDSESNPYHRTPRPDLLSHPSESEYDIIYRTGKAYKGSNLNLVGVESDSKNNSTFTTDEPTYSLPSHWSTEYSQLHTTNKPSIGDQSDNNVEKKNVHDVVSTIRGETITESSLINFKSLYKNTTPVFPKIIDVISESPDDLSLLPPVTYPLSNKMNNTEMILKEIPANFRSMFKATTPVYPTFRDITSEEPSEVGLLPPLALNHNNKAIKNDVAHSSYVEIELSSANSNSSKNFNSSEEITDARPSIHYEPPKNIDFENKDGAKLFDNNEWTNLRKKYLIPDYEFPLESVSRPSYDSILSSFQVSSGPPENVIKTTKDMV